MESLVPSRLFHPQLGQTVRYSITEVPESGDAQTGSVIGIMRRYVLEDCDTPEIRADLDSALASAPGSSMLDAIHSWVRNRVSFVQDEQTAIPFQSGVPGPIVETLIRPRDMAAFCANSTFCQRQGDCDDFSMYTAALLLAAGIPCSFVTVAAAPGHNDFTHVYVAAYPLNSPRVAMDTSHGAYAGWETDKAHRVQEWKIAGGIGGLDFLTLAGTVSLAAGLIVLHDWWKRIRSS